MGEGTEVRPISIEESPFDDGELLAWKFKGQEELGQPFRYDVELLSPNGELDFSKAMGKPMSFKVETNQGDPRFFHGMVSHFEQGGVVGRLHHYLATLRPWWWFEGFRSHCGVYQTKKTPDIAQAIFDAAGATGDQFEVSLSGTYAEREYCIQFRETNFNFLSRLFEEEGIYYYFKHTADGHKMVLCDDVANHSPFFESDGGSTVHIGMESNRINSWRVCEDTASDKHRIRDSDFEKFGVAVDGTAQVEGAGYEIYEYPARAMVKADADARAAIRVAGQMARSHVVKGETVQARNIQAGFQFSLEDHPRGDQNADYLALSAEYSIMCDDHQGAGLPDGEDAFRCTFTAVPADKQFRPVPATPRPAVPGPQSAKVVGKSGEDVFTDKYGRVKVMFHWDIEGAGDETSCCWVRVAQFWAGNGFGALFTPRIGQEVIVSFLDGDMDRPVVVGSLYNSANAIPYDPSATPTTSTIKTRTFSTTDKANELRFDDKADAEEILIHAQKDMNVFVVNDRKESVGNDQDLTITGIKKEKVVKDRNEKVEGEHKEEIGKDRSLTVKGKEAKQVDGQLSLTVKGDVVEVFKGKHSEETTGDVFIKGDNIILEASTNISLIVGGNHIAIEASGIEIKSSGSVKIDGSTVEAVGSVSAKLEGKMVDVKGTAKGTVDGGGMLEVKGGMVKIN